MSAWFTMLGEPVSADELDLIADYIRGVGVGEDVPVEQVRSFGSARAVITSGEWDRRYWDAEQAEKQRLCVTARELHGETHFLQLQTSPLQLGQVVYGAAAGAAARFGCSDVGLIGAAAGAASEALHLAELAELSGAPRRHPFLLKRAVFEGGHWPLGALGGRYHVF